MNNNNPFAAAKTQAMDFKRDILKKVYSIEALKGMLEKTSIIDYVVKFHLKDKEDTALNEILAIREQLGMDIPDERKNILKLELAKLEPEEDVKYIILIEDLLANSDNYNLGIGLEEHSLQPLFYNGRYWEQMSLPLLKEFLAEIATISGFNYYTMRLTKNISKIFEQFSNLAILPMSDNDENEVKINLQNGTYVISNEKYGKREFRKHDYFKYQLPFSYDETAQCPTFHKFLDEVLDKESQMTLAEYIGYIFTRGLKLEKCLILYGAGSNGKSVVFEIVQALLGETNVCSYTLSSLCNENGYYRAQLGNCLLNYSSELGGKNSNPDTFKKLISNEPIEARSPYGKPFILHKYGKFMFNANKTPRGKEYTHAYWRRFIFLNFKRIFSEEEQDKDLAKKIIETELSGIFNWVLEGLKRLLEQKKFTESESSKELLEEIKTETDSVAIFLEAKGYVPSFDRKDKMKVSDLRAEYHGYCQLQKITPVQQSEFKKRIGLLGITVEKGQGKQDFAFIKKDDSSSVPEDFNMMTDVI